MNNITWNTTSVEAAQEEALDSFRSRFETVRAMLVTSATMESQYIRVSDVAEALEIGLPKVVYRAIEVVVSLILPPGFNEDDLDNDRLFHSPNVQLTERMHLQGIQIEDCATESVRPFDPNNID